MKNHVNGLGYEDGRILVTSHGVLPGRDDSEEKKSIEDYKRISGDYISEKLGVSVADIADTKVVTEEV